MQLQGTPLISWFNEMEHGGPVCTLGCHGVSGQKRGMAEAADQTPSSLSPDHKVMMRFISLPVAANQKA